MNISIKKATAKGKRYAYIRGTGVALVRGFVGTEHQFDAAVAAALRGLGKLPLRSAPTAQIEPGGELVSVLDRLRLDHAKAMHARCSGRSRELKRSYTLSAELIHRMLFDAGDGCTITGIPFDYRRDPKHRINPMAPSLDRIDNGLGYEVGNVRLVCTCVNIALNEWGLDNFKRVCRALTQNTKIMAILENQKGEFSKKDEASTEKCRDILYL